MTASSTPDDDELELEPVDPEILEHQRKRSEERIHQVQTSAEVEEAYEAAVSSDPIELEQLKQFRFTNEHLLVLTGLFSIFSMLLLRLGAATGVFISFVLVLATAWYFVLRKERREAELIEQRREEAKARVAAERAKSRGEHAVVFADPPPADESEIVEPVAERPGFQFSFSPLEILSSLAGSLAIVLLLTWILSLANASLMFAAIALVGIIVLATQYRPLPIVIFAWWSLLVIHVLVSLAYATMGG